MAGGLIPGYARYKAALSPQEYVNRVLAGELRDPTLSFQLRNGFEVRGLLRDYIEASASANWATLLVWENPEFTVTGGPKQPSPNHTQHPLIHSLCCRFEHLSGGVVSILTRQLGGCSYICRVYFRVSPGGEQRFDDTGLSIYAG